MEWRYLSEVADIIDSLHQTPEYVSTGYPMVRVTDVKPGSINLKDCKYVTESVFLEYTKKRIPQKGDIVISRVGTYGVFSYVQDDTPFCLGQNTALIIPKINSDFLYYCLNSAETKAQIEQMVVGATQKTISLKNIKQIKIPLFPSEYMKKVSGILESITSLIECNHQINDNLLQQAEMLISREILNNT